MDLKGSLVDTQLKIYPTQKLLDFLQTINDNSAPVNIQRLIKGSEYKGSVENNHKVKCIQLSNKDIEYLNKLKEIVGEVEEGADGDYCEASQVDANETEIQSNDNKDLTNKHNSTKLKESTELNTVTSSEESQEGMKLEKDIEVDTSTKKSIIDIESKNDLKKFNKPYLTTTDIDWLYHYIKNVQSKGGKDIPYLHSLLEGVEISMPENQIIKRNPVLEARCVKLRAQQEAREYRKMTKTVDNVRIKFPEDSISYQLKQLNRQLIAIGQFILSIFAGFLFGFKGVEWLVGNLDFGFRLLLGVMCALVIALAEIYFLAKKLNEELNIPETTQLGGPPKFVDESKYMWTNPSKPTKVNKEHQD